MSKAVVIGEEEYLGAMSKALDDIGLDSYAYTDILVYMRDVAVEDELNNIVAKAMYRIEAIIAIKGGVRDKLLDHCICREKE